MSAAQTLSASPRWGHEPATTADRSLYFINWWMDAALVGGLSIIAWIGFGLFGGDTKLNVILPLGLMIGFPHFSATIYRLCQSPQHTRQFPITSWVLPLLMIGAVVACVWQTQTVLPYFLLLYFLWSPYHYSGQTTGLTMIYAKRSGFSIGPRQRLAFTGFVLSTFVAAYSGARPEPLTKVFDVVVPMPLFPDFVHTGALLVMAISGVVFVFYATRWCLRQKRILPPIVLLPAVTQVVWFIPGRSVLEFAALIPVFHALQYLMVACVVQLKHRIDVPGVEGSRRRIGLEALRWAVRNIAGGAFLFFGIPTLLGLFSVPVPIAFAAVSAAINIHHFFVDGVIWKLRTASTASALMTNVFQLAGQPGAAPIGVSPAPATPA